MNVKKIIHSKTSMELATVPRHLKFMKSGEDIMENVKINHYIDNYLFKGAKHYVEFGYICKICECNPNNLKFDNNVLLCVSSGRFAGKMCHCYDVSNSETYVSFITRDVNRLHQEYLSIMLKYFLAKDIKLKFRKRLNSPLHEITHILFPLPKYSRQLKFVRNFKKFLDSL